MSSSWLRFVALSLGSLVACEAGVVDDDALADDETTDDMEASSEAAAFDDELGLANVMPGVDAPDPTDGDIEPEPDPGFPPPFLLDRIVGVGIAGSGLSYAWTSVGTVSAGLPEQLTFERSPYRWSSAIGSSVVDTAISSVDRTYVWFANGTAGRGYTNDPTALATWAYTLPGGRVPGDIAGIAIYKANDRTYAFYEDGTYSTGNSAALGATSCCAAYSMPPGKTPQDIVGMDFAPNGRLHTWYDDGSYSVGTSTDLDVHQAPRRYARHGMLASRWPANAPNITGPETDWPPLGIAPNYNGPQVTAPPATTIDVPVGGSSFDLLVAPGHDALGIAFDASVYFYDKSGNPLSGGGLANDGRLPLEQVFAEFVRASPVTPGQEAPNDVNQYIGFPQACDGPAYPDTGGNGYCVSSAPYDTRVHFDPVGGRFVILANLRNYLWTNFYSNQYANPELSDEELYDLPLDDVNDNCGAYTLAVPMGGVTSAPVPDGAHCKLARRLLAIAVSRTADPRDGFFTYVFVENSYRDWPWMAIDDEWIILSHHGAEQPQAPAATLVSLADLRAGNLRPQYVHYFPSDLGGRKVVEPPQQLGSWNDRSLVVDVSGSTWWMFALPHPTQPYAKQPATMLQTTLADAPGFSREKAVFRHGKLHLMGEIEVAVAGEPGQVTSRVRHVRVPVGLSNGVPTASTAAASGYLMTQFLPHVAHRADEPIAAVNGADQTLLVWAYAGTDPEDEVPPLVEHSMLRKGTTTWDLRRTFRAGDAYAEGYPRLQIKAIAAAVDPVDDRTMWAVHKYGRANGTWGVVVGAVDPAP